MLIPFEQHLSFNLNIVLNITKYSYSTTVLKCNFDVLHLQISILCKQLFFYHHSTGY